MGARAERLRPFVSVSAVVLSRGLVSTAGVAAALGPPPLAAERRNTCRLTNKHDLVCRQDKYIVQRFLYLQLR